MTMNRIARVGPPEKAREIGIHCCYHNREQFLYSDGLILASYNHNILCHRKKRQFIKPMAIIHF